ncbi:MAG: OPT family oligopeptide transporter [Myxococcota bacterium]
MASPPQVSDAETRPYPELTVVAVVVGYGLGALITVAIGYASLILGFSVEGSELAAILGWGVLRGGLRRKSIVENNINQTVASAVNGASAGMMFSVPALFILEAQYPGVTAFNPVLMVAGCILGGALGIAFVIPLRKQMIDYNRLAYPGGIAVAAILKSPGAGIRKANLLLGSAALSAAVHFLVTQVVKVPHETWALGAMWSLPSFLNVNFYLSLLTVGAGFLSGRGGLVFGIGGFLCYWILSPALAAFGPVETRALVEEGPNTLREVLFRPSGIGILIGAAVGGVLGALPLIRSALRSMQEAARASGRDGRDHDELSIRVLYGVVSAGVAGLVVIAWWASPDMTLGRALIMALVGTLWIGVAGVIVSECVGRTNWSPLSGMTLIAVTVLVFVAGGLPTPETVIVSITVGAAICVAIAQASDLMLDLKSGYLTGAQPRAQQLGQFLGTWLGPLLVMGLIFVLHREYGLGTERLPAPQGQALASMVGGIVGGDVPAFRYLAGAALGGVLALSGLGGVGVQIGLGFYMPFSIVLTYTVGVALRVASNARLGNRWSEDTGIPIAAGFIVGEALVGVGIALAAVLGVG